MGGAARDEGEYRYDEPGDHAPGVDAQKKSVRAAERDEVLRRRWVEQAAGLDIHELVFVDEFGSNTALARAYARAPRGWRTYDSLPRNRGPNTTVIASLTLQGMGACMQMEGAVDTAAFEVYVEQLLAPTLRAGQVVVMDNLGAHKGDRVRELVEARGARVLFLPAYSPDLNPIEEAIAKIKGILKRIGARTHDSLNGAISLALDAITPQDARSYFANSGYLPVHQNL